MAGRKAGRHGQCKSAGAFAGVGRVGNWRLLGCHGPLCCARLHAGCARSRLVSSVALCRLCANQSARHQSARHRGPIGRWRGLSASITARRDGRLRRVASHLLGQPARDQRCGDAGAAHAHHRAAARTRAQHSVAHRRVVAGGGGIGSPYACKSWIGWQRATGRGVGSHRPIRALESAHHPSVTRAVAAVRLRQVPAVAGRRLVGWRAVLVPEIFDPAGCAVSFTEPRVSEGQPVVQNADHYRGGARSRLPW